MAGVIGALALGGRAGADDFATRVIDYTPAPGQFVNDPFLDDPASALGPPIGGGLSAPDSTKLVSLGGFGGSITLGFDHTVLDDPCNPFGMDAMVFGNSFFVGGDPTKRWAEAAVIEISRDENGNGEADDAWFVVRGSSLSALPLDAWRTQAWDDDEGSPTPPANSAWYPVELHGAPAPEAYSTGAYELGAPVTAMVLMRPAEPPPGAEAHWGYAARSPGRALPPGAEADEFYTSPDDPLALGISAGSCGGDALDIAWAVDAATGAPAGLAGFDFIRVSSAVAAVGPIFGEMSAEIGGVADVRALLKAGDINGDCAVNTADLGLLLGAFGGADEDADLTGDGIVDTSDLGILLGGFGE